PQVGVAMQAADLDAMLAAAQRLQPRLGGAVPDMIELARLSPGESFDARAALKERGRLGAVVGGTLQEPVLTATAGRLDWWRGPVSLVAAEARRAEPTAFPAVATDAVATSGASEAHGRMRTAQAGQVLLFLLTML